MRSGPSAEVISFRDPAGRVFHWNGRVFRIVAESGVKNASLYLESEAIQQLISEGLMIPAFRARPEDASTVCRRAGVEPEHVLVLEHERVRFPSFPYEWPREMLHAAAELTLTICDRMLKEGLCLKDATPFNILFKGPEPVFVDALSVEQRDPHDPVWLPYAQFLTTFVLPLLATKNLGFTLDQIFISRREGLKPEELHKALGIGQKLKPSVFLDVVLPTWLGKTSRSEDERIYRKRTLSDPDRAALTIGHLFKGLHRRIESLRPSGSGDSAWSDYDRRNSYSADEAQKKRASVNAVLQDLQPKAVLDIGCNRGTFSRLAAAAGAWVVAIDSDPVVLGSAYTEAKREGLDVLSLVVDIARPSPSLGWMNEECPSFLERATKRFDLVMMLAVVHHLIVTERVPLDRVIDLVARLTTKAAIIEYISPGDPMFKKLVRGREHLHADLTEEKFESECKQRFATVQKIDLGVTRALYVLRSPIELSPSQSQ